MSGEKVDLAVAIEQRDRLIARAERAEIAARGYFWMTIILLCSTAAATILALSLAVSR